MLPFAPSALLELEVDEFRGVFRLEQENGN
jgi:hypothetical protein